MAERVRMPEVETHLIPSAHVRQTFRISVAQPAQLPGDQTPLPVVYATDANNSFDAFRQLLYTMGTRVILVGIGYPSDSLTAGARLRGRDLTFPGYPEIDLGPINIEGVLEVEEGTPSLRGADEFQLFVEDELIPLIDATYATVPGDRTYFGHSAGGGFGLYTMFTRSSLFSKYVISSPGLVYNGTTSGITYEDYDFALQLARRFGESGKSLDGVRMYMSVGTDEEFEPGMEVWQLTSTYYRMARLLHDLDIPGLELILQDLPGETHGTAWIVSFIHGVQAVHHLGRWATS